MRVSQVEREVGDGEHVAGAGCAAAQQRAHARDQLLDRERLDEVVVGAGVEPGDALGDGVAGGQQQDRDAPAPFPRSAPA